MFGVSAFGSEVVGEEWLVVVVVVNGSGDVGEED